MTWLQRDALGPVGPLVFNPYAIILNPYAPHRSKRVLIISGLQGEAGLGESKTRGKKPTLARSWHFYQDRPCQSFPVTPWTPGVKCQARPKTPAFENACLLKSRPKE